MVRLDAGTPRDWYVLVHQLPPTPLYLRAKIRNRLAGVGAISLKNSVYVLPAREDGLEDLQWIAGEAIAGGGSAYVCRAEFLAGVTNDDLVGAFRAQADAAFKPIAQDAAALLRQRRAAKGSKASSPVFDSAVQRLRKKFEQVARVDFFESAGGREVTAMLRALEPRPRASTVGIKGDYVGRVWVTRHGPKVDRMASGWLVRRFIDPAARFRFIDPARDQRRPAEVTFDMVGGDFTHDGDRCTFETLLSKFNLGGDAALRAIGEIVHDIDLKDDRFGRPETPGVRLLVDGVVKARAEDDGRMQRGAEVFDDLYASLGGAASTSTPTRRRVPKRRAKRS